MCEICSKLTIKTPVRRGRSGVFLLLLLLLTLNKFTPFPSVLTVDFEQVNVFEKNHM